MRRAAAIGLLVATVFMATAPPTAQAAERRSARILLNSLPVSAEHNADFRRTDFASWRDVDGDGCDTRQEVLITERVQGQVADCDVQGGRWRSSYDGVTTADPRSFDIDHRVPLKEAWASGAWRWTPVTRGRFSNDLEYAAALLAVTAHSNRSKSDQEPSEWMPELASQRCSYVKLWIGVKYRWRLAVDSAEKSYLAEELRTCDPRMTVPQLAEVDFR